MTSPKHALYFEGPNPTADMALFRPSADHSGYEALLIQRGDNVAACPGLPAFPGGFVNSQAGQPRFVATERPDEAARRELTEETGLVAGRDVELIECGVWEAPWRDPRNGDGRFARSHLFAAMMPAGFGPEPQGLDDAKAGETRWVRLSELTGATLAFDHGAMLSACCAKLGISDPGAKSWALERLWNRREDKAGAATDASPI